MRWIVAPLLAALFLGTSGFLHELEEMTEASVAMAEAGEEAPAATRKAAENVEQLPLIAELTTRQAEAFATLADALQVSARRVFSLNETLDEQATAIDDLIAATRGLSEPLGCVERRLRRLTQLAAQVPPGLREIPPIVTQLIAAQEKSIRHLRSINRKLTAFGAVARASRVKVPPIPEAPDLATEPEEPGARSC